MGQGCGHLSVCLELKQPCPSSRSWLWQLRFLTGWTWASPEGCLQQGSSLPPAEVIQERERDRTPSKEPESACKMEATVCFKPNPGSDVPSRQYSVPKPNPHSTGGDSIVVPPGGRDHCGPSPKLPAVEVELQGKSGSGRGIASAKALEEGYAWHPEGLRRPE